jgi:hypothetical protein
MARERSIVRERVELLVMEVRCDTAAPAAVRASMSSLRGLGWALGDAILIASELVTSIVRQTGRASGRWLEVRVSRDFGSILIAVARPRHGGHRPRGDDRWRQVSDGHAIDELGRMVIDRPARRWGADSDRMWAQVALGGRV